MYVCIYIYIYIYIYKQLAKATINIIDKYENKMQPNTKKQTEPTATPPPYTLKTVW